MHNNYFDKWRFNKILEKVDKDPYQAKILFENYLDEYPKDYSAYSFYASCLITLGLFEEAEKVIDNIENVYKYDNKYLSGTNSDKVITLIRNIIYAKIKLLCRQHKYKEVYDYYLTNYIYTKDMDIQRVILYCKAKLNLIEDTNRDNYFYFMRQTIDYKYSDFLCHIKRHLNSDIWDEEERCSFFNKSFPTLKVISEIDKYLMSDKRLLFGFTEDIYIFRYDECGIYNKKSANFFKVVTFNGSKNIITMYPVIGYENLPYVDLNYMKNEDKPKIKMLSQIDKFNNKYGIK